MELCKGNKMSAQQGLQSNYGLQGGSRRSSLYVLGPVNGSNGWGIGCREGLTKESVWYLLPQTLDHGMAERQVGNKMAVGTVRSHYNKLSV